MNEQKKSGVRFNLFDAILILIALVCIGAIAFHIYFTSTHADKMQDSAKVTFEISGVSDMTANAFCKEGATLYLQKGGAKIGTLGETAVSPMQVYAEAPDGKLVTVSHPAKKNIDGIAVFTGIWTDNGFMVDGQVPVNVGKTVDIFTKDVMCTLTVTGVSR